MKEEISVTFDQENRPIKSAYATTLPRGGTALFAFSSRFTSLKSTVDNEGLETARCNRGGM